MPGIESPVNFAPFSFGSSSVSKSTSGNVSTPVGNTYRGPFSSIFNANGIAKEDWQRDEQHAYEAWLRSEKSAQNNREFQERMARNSYQYAVEDLKKAGLNPLLAVSQGGASTPSGSAGSSHSASGRNYQDSASTLLRIMAGLVLALK
ncbi:MAG: DNA pilot protein [Chaetfec virus UA24_2285]|nr:MAG: DNA pilot protein [Chaetfec virus UA24_2285]